MASRADLLRLLAARSAVLAWAGGFSAASFPADTLAYFLSGLVDDEAEILGCLRDLGGLMGEW